MSSVIVHRHAARYLQRLPKDIKQRIKNVLQQLEQNPIDLPGIKHMAGEWSGYCRLRTGNYRIIFWFDANEDIVYVDYIGARGDVYK
ncbi:type II toxin-antitoxin system RelE/ParE family toxin [Thermodesulfobacteriota bacterium]